MIIILMMTMMMMMMMIRTSINVWDLAASTSIFSWDGHGDWVQVFI